MVALKRENANHGSGSPVWKQERRGGIETPQGPQAIGADAVKQERRGGIETLEDCCQ